MIADLFNQFLALMKTTAPVTITINIMFAVGLLVIGLILLNAGKNKTRSRRVGGIVSISLSVLGFVGALSTWLATYFIF